MNGPRFLSKDEEGMIAFVPAEEEQGSPREELPLDQLADLPCFGCPNSLFNDLEISVDWLSGAPGKPARGSTRPGYAGLLRNIDCGGAARAEPIFTALVGLVTATMTATSKTIPGWPNFKPGYYEDDLSELQPVLDGLNLLMQWLARLQREKHMRLHVYVSRKASCLDE